MRYNPATDRALYTIDEIAEQCRAAVLRAQTHHNCSQVDYSEVRKFFHYDDGNVFRMKDYGSLVK